MIGFRQYYSELVEHYFRMAVRYQKVVGETAQRWLSITNNWIDKQSDEDRNFIRFVFDYQFFNKNDGLFHYKNGEDMFSKRERLAALEKQFAITSGLIPENEAENKW